MTHVNATPPRLLAPVRPMGPVQPRGVEPTPGPKVPDWVKDAVFYPVFPDRVANRDAGKHPQGTHPEGSPRSNDGNGRRDRDPLPPTDGSSGNNH